MKRIIRRRDSRGMVDISLMSVLVALAIVALLIWILRQV